MCRGLYNKYNFLCGYYWYTLAGLNDDGCGFCGTAKVEKDEDKTIIMAVWYKTPCEDCVKTGRYVLRNNWAWELA